MEVLALVLMMKQLPARDAPLAVLISPSFQNHFWQAVGLTPIGESTGLPSRVVCTRPPLGGDTFRNRRGSSFTRLKASTFSVNVRPRSGVPTAYCHVLSGSLSSAIFSKSPTRFMDDRNTSMSLSAASGLSTIRMTGLVLEEKNPDARIINLETAITEQDTAWPRKFVRYRMHPENVKILKEAEIDCCVLSNNHVCDWGFEGMADTMKYLEEAEVAHTGVGPDLEKAKAPGIVQIPGFGRVLVFGAAHLSSGVPRGWMAGEDKPGVHCLDFIDVEETAKNLTEHINKYKQREDKVVVSIHWGDNYNWDVKETQVNFAHALMDGGSVDIIHGHSSHHLKGLEIYNKKLIMYGCGDFLNDYEGIVKEHDEEFRDDLSLMYFVEVDHKTGNFVSLTAVPMEIRHMQSNTADEKDVDWLEETFKKQCEKFGATAKRTGEEFLVEA